MFYILPNCFRRQAKDALQLTTYYLLLTPYYLLLTTYCYYYYCYYYYCYYYYYYYQLNCYVSVQPGSRTYGIHLVSIECLLDRDSKFWSANEYVCVTHAIVV